jgi:Fe-S-cluster containining protein
MDEIHLSPSATPLRQGESFCFSCHPGVPCFTECCRQLELALTPYDVLRLKNCLHITSQKFLDLYVIIEQQEHDILPLFFLTMVDDGRASCPFVSPEGCRVYSDRPGACRFYPLGRGAQRRQDGGIAEQYVLLREPHCLGFKESQQLTISGWTKNQQLAPYLHFNDLLAEIVQHPGIRSSGGQLNQKQLKTYILALYDLDRFRDEMLNRIPAAVIHQYGFSSAALAVDDETLLRFCLSWIKKELLG